jgi:hypothetical protein
MMAKTKLEILGVYPIEAQEPVHIVELVIHNSKGKVDLFKITQELPGQPASNWQVPYDEKFLDEEGQKVIADDYQVRSMPEIWNGEVRLVFFFHYLDLRKKLLTPFGKIRLPKESPKPDRLSFIEYTAPW